MKILLVNLAEAADAAEAVLSASFQFEGMVADIWQLNDVTAADLRQIFTDSPVDGVYVGGGLRRELAAMCDELEGDARTLGSIDSVRAGRGTLIGDNTSALALELGMSERRMWPRTSGQVLVLGEGEWAQSAALAFSRVSTLRVAFATERVTVRDEFHMSWNEPAFHNRLADADLLLNTTDLPLADLPFTPGELSSRCNVACTGVGTAVDEIVTAIAGVHRNVMNGDEILLASMMLCFSRWTDIQPPPTGVAREALK
jgi:shikimate 5-dehydrogenase